MGKKREGPRGWTSVALKASVGGWGFFHPGSESGIKDDDPGRWNAWVHRQLSSYFLS